MLSHADPTDLERYLERLTDEWDNREKMTGVTSDCCRVECIRGGISGALYCSGCAKHVGPAGQVKS